MIMNKKIINLLFFLISFLLIFNNFYIVFPFNIFAGYLADKLVFYPMFIGVIYTLYCQYKFKNIFVKFDIFKKFTFIYFGWICVSLILGLYNYPYYDLILNNLSNQSPKLITILNFFDKFNIFIEEKFGLVIWMIIRAFKTILFEFLYTFCMSYVIYCWYHNNWKTAFEILIKALLASAFVVILYSTFEIFYFTGAEWAKDILITITPYFHAINIPGTAYGNWPPLLPPGIQLRSIFAEPSYFGIYSSFLLPFIWYNISNNNNKNKIGYILILFSLCFCLFLTQSRTAIGLLIGEIILFLILTIYNNNFSMLENFMIISFVILLSFLLSNSFINNCIDEKLNKNINITSSEYIDRNFLSLLSEDRRSNSARYAYIKSAFRIGKDNKLFGVGSGLTSPYMTDYFTWNERNVFEVKLRIDKQIEEGIFVAHMPILCEYIKKFAEIGVLGTIIYFMPLIYLIMKLYKKMKERQEYIFFFISLLGIMASGISHDFLGACYYWVLLGLGYAMCFGKENEEKKV